MNSPNSERPSIVLASSSPYRRELLARLGLAFDCLSPEIDETRRAGESLEQSCQRLAREKAQRIAKDRPDSLIIGSDQLCGLRRQDGEEQVFGKPGGLAAARRQLQQLSGQRVRFVTALCVVHEGRVESSLDNTEVCFRKLDDASIVRYLEAESEAIYCAGSFVSERLGISLCESIDSRDPSALIGLPLIQLCELLRRFELTIP